MSPCTQAMDKSFVPKLASVLIVTMLAVGVSRTPDPSTEFLLPPRSEVATILASAVEESFGKQYCEFLESRISALMVRLNVFMPALPKNGHGNLGPSSVRYLMHRYFVQSHGWHVNGFDPQGSMWNSSSPIAALGDLVPTNVKALFEEELHAKGFGLSEVAVLAGTMETLVHHESRELLRGAYDALRMPRDGDVSIAEATELVDAHMTAFILGKNFSTSSLKTMSPRRVRRRIRNIVSVYPGWVNTKVWIRTVQKEILGDATRVNFTQVGSVIDAIGDRYGDHQDSECFNLKSLIEAYESPSYVGCVRLVDFYGSGKWQFAEHPQYLRTLGVLDESSPEDPKVLTANYILAPTNCVANSNFYRVCCRDHCGELLDSVVRKVSAPHASPQEIVDVVSVKQVPSELLQQRLRDVARRAGGKVPLYGRLFAQWLHQLTPRECPFPHLAGQTKPQWLDTFEETSNINPVFSEEAMANFISQHNATPKHVPDTNKKATCVPWQSEEEMLPQDWSADDDSFLVPQAWAMFFASVAVVCMLLQTMSRIKKSGSRVISKGSSMKGSHI